jgi:hypothetical protein
VDHWVIVAGSLRGTAVAKKSSSRGKGKGKGKDVITGRTLQLTSDGRTIELKDDVVYEFIDQSTDTVADDLIRSLRSVPTGAPPDGAYYIQIQLGDDAIALTRVYDIDTVYRSVDIAKTSYDRKGKAKISSFSDLAYMQTLTTVNPDRRWGAIRHLSSPYTIPSSSIGEIPLDLGIEIARLGEFQSNPSDPSSPIVNESGGGLPAFRAFGGGKFFYEGWQLDPFNTSLV